MPHAHCAETGGASTTDDLLPVSLIFLTTRSERRTCDTAFACQSELHSKLTGERSSH